MKRWVVLLALMLPALTASGQDAVPRDEHQMHRVHRDPKAYISMLEDPQRDAYQKPHEVLTALGIKQGEMIADIGAGSGYFTFRLAHHAGENGKVYAVDVNPDMILHLNRRIRELKARNVVSILAAADDPLLSAHSVDRFFFCDSWHHIRAQTKYLSLVRKMLKPGGEVIMIDFHKRKQPVGPPLPMRIAREDLLQQMESHGFQLKQEHTFLPYQYFLVFVPK
jgi:ubiquinone/menaquinone biosynthesis C-methylase UbiE